MKGNTMTRSHWVNKNWAIKNWAVTGSVLLGLMGCHSSGDGRASLPPKGEVPATAAAPTAEPAVTTPAAPATAAPAASPVAAPSTAAEAKGTATESGASVATAGPGGAAPITTSSAVDYRLTGQVSAMRHSQLTFRVSGFIKSVPLKPGTQAKEGQVIATVDDRDFVVRVELAKARRDSARVQFAAAEKELQREQELKKANASTASNFDKVKSGFDLARVGLRLAELDLEQADLALKDTKLTAPYDCVVSSQLKFDGEPVQVMPPSPVVEIYDTSEPEIALSAPERLMGQIHVGSPLKISVPSAGFTGKGEVTRIVPVINEKSRTFQVIAKFLAYDQEVVPGTYAEATIE